MKKAIAMLLMCFMTVSTLFASLADPKPVTIRQSDGKPLTVCLKGDEIASWAKTTDNYTLLRNKNDVYVYAISDGKGGMKPSDMVAHDPKYRSEEEQTFVSSLSTDIFYSSEQISMLKQYSDIRKDFKQKTSLLKSSQDKEEYKMLVILMSFNDYEFTTPKKDVEDLFNQVGYSASGHPGSVHDYFDASSFGKLDLQATVVGPYTADSSITYYGQSGTYTNPYTGQEVTINDMHVRDLIIEAVKHADSTVDFSQYTNGSNYVSCVYVIYAGYSQAVGGNPSYLIWPHRSYLLSDYYVDGVYVHDYGCSSENPGSVGSNEAMKIGTICHEFSHVLGQPDYYDTDYGVNGQAFNPGDWDVMAQGNYNGGGAFPPVWSAMERKERLYITLDTIINNYDITVPDLQHSNKAYMIYYPGNTSEYIILENRQKTGFDFYLPGHGLMAYRVDMTVSGWQNNCINCVSTNTGYTLITADNQYNPYYFHQGQPFPGSTQNTELSNTSTPSAKSKSGTNANAQLYRIDENTQTGNIILHSGDTTGRANIRNFVLSYNEDTLTAKADILNASVVAIAQKGFVYSPISDVPTVNDSIIIDNTSSSSIAANINNLNGDTYYYIRPFVKTTTNTFYGESIKIKTPCAATAMFPYEFSFEDEQIQCWQQETDKYAYNKWKVIDTVEVDGAIQGGHNGGHAVYIHSDYGNSYQTTKLITPAMDVTVLDKPILKFWHHQKTNLTQFDNLKVYYRTDPSKEWVLLKMYSESANTWKKDSLLIPEKSRTLYIAFESVLKGGLGIGIDDISVTDNSAASWPVVKFESVDNITDNSALFAAKVVSSGYTPLTKTGFVYSENPMPTTDDYVVETNSQNIGQFELNAENLESSTEYYVRAFAMNGGLIAYSEQEKFVTRCAKITEFPYDVNVATQSMCVDMQDGWKEDTDDNAYVFESSTAGFSSKLILPIMDLSYKDSMSVTFDYKQANANTDIIKVYYRKNVESPWIMLSQIADNDLAYTSKTVNIPTDGYQSADAYIAFEASAAANGKVYVRNIEVRAVSQIPFISTDSAFLQTYNSIKVNGTVSYTGMSEITQAGICWSKNAEPTVADTKVLSTISEPDTFSCMVNGLEPLTDYYVRTFATNQYGTAYGKTVKITTPFTPIFNNTISGDQSWCEGTVPQVLNGSIPTGGNGEYTYRWIKSTNQTDWEDCNEGSVNDKQNYSPRQLFVTSYYRRVVTSYVSVDTSNTVTITIDPASKGGNVFRMYDSVDVSSTQRVMELRAYTGSILYWERLQDGYDWEIITLSQDSVFLTDTYQDTGYYYYRATVKSGECNAAQSGEDSIHVVNPVSLSGVEDVCAMNVLPNPSKGEVYINFSSSKSGSRADITVADVNGQTVYRQQTVLKNGLNALNLSSLSDGTYVITVKTDGKTLQDKLIILR
ncbi:MAG: M6 family metalloprotease domain-containing protein [Bacteroidales bacterium]|nr:M6 family metalloprotease domain-containing protein [Bacteroidales bacterium]